MASGVGFQLTVHDAELREAFRRLRSSGGDGLVQACLKNIGIAVVKQTRQRFADQKDPKGNAWAPLNPEYAKGKRGTKILQEQGMAGGLMGSVTYRVGDGYVEIGTNKVYGPIHQFGGTIVPRTAGLLVFKLGGKTVFARKVTIPARPFLGLSEVNKADLLGVIGDHIERIWEGRP